MTKSHTDKCPGAASRVSLALLAQVDAFAALAGAVYETLALVPADRRRGALHALGAIDHTIGELRRRLSQEDHPE